VISSVTFVYIFAGSVRHFVESVCAFDNLGAFRSVPSISVLAFTFVVWAWQFVTDGVLVTVVQVGVITLLNFCARMSIAMVAMVTSTAVRSVTVSTCGAMPSACVRTMRPALIGIVTDIAVTTVASLACTCVASLGVVTDSVHLVTTMGAIVTLIDIFACSIMLFYVASFTVFITFYIWIT